MEARKYAYFANSLEFEFLTLSNELCLKLEISVEMFFDCAFPFAYYHKNICNTRCDSLINYVLNYAGEEKNLTNSFGDSSSNIVLTFFAPFGDLQTTRRIPVISTNHIDCRKGDLGSVFFCGVALSTV